MKRKILPLTVTLLGAAWLLIPDLQAATHVRVGVGVGGVGVGVGVGPRHGGYYPYYHQPYRTYWRGYYPYGTAYWGPTVVYSPAIYVPEPATQTTTTVTTVSSASPAAVAQEPPAPTPLAVKSTTPPYGIPQDNGQVKSPFSNFSISDAGMKPGTIVYDVHTGQPFRIP